MSLTAAAMDLNNTEPLMPKAEVAEVRKWEPREGGNESVRIVDSADGCFVILKNIKIEAIDPVIRKTHGQIDSLRISNKWKAESIAPPNVSCKKLAKSVTKNIYENFNNEYPIRIAPTIEEGVFLYYKNFDNKMEMNVEVYNDLDIVAILFKDDQVIKSYDIFNEDFTEVFRSFQKS
jgi:hypothetical protein